MSIGLLSSQEDTVKYCYITHSKIKDHLQYCTLMYPTCASNKADIQGLQVEGGELAVSRTMTFQVHKQL